MEIFPVVHIKDIGVATEQAIVALELGANGVYLIDHHSGSLVPSMQVFKGVRGARPGSFVGVNFLGETPLSALEYLASAAEYSNNLRRDLPDALWVDDCSALRVPTRLFREGRPEITELVMYAGGVAFKHTSGHTEEPVLAAELAEMYKDEVDIVVTSGPGTGEPTTQAKVDAMKEAIGDRPLAVASGVSLANIRDFRSADQVFVSTSVETYTGSGVFDVPILERTIESALKL